MHMFSNGIPAYQIGYWKKNFIVLLDKQHLYSAALTVNVAEELALVSPHVHALTISN